MEWNYGYNPYPEYSFPCYIDDQTAILIALIGIAVLFALVIGLVLYIVQAIGVYRLSKNRGYRHAWLAFVPIVNNYVLGGIADNVNACYGRKSSWRIWLLLLPLLSCVFGLAVGLSIGASVQIVRMETLVPLMLLPVLLCWAISVTTSVLTYIVLYRVFRDYTNLAVLYLVLSIFFGVTQPFFLFSLRNKPSASLAYRNQFFQNAQASSVGTPVYSAAQPTEQPPQEPLA